MVGSPYAQSGNANGRSRWFRRTRDAVKLEQRDIDLYAERIGLPLIATGTGIRYHLFRDVPGAASEAGPMGEGELPPWN